MKILVVCQYYYPEQFRVNDICETLVTMGHDVTVLTGLPNYPKGKVHRDYRWFRNQEEIISGVNVIRAPLFGRGKGLIRLLINYVSFILTSIIRTLFLEKDYDVVYVYQLSPITMAIPALFYKKLTGKKVLLYCLDIWPESIVASGLDKSSPIYKLLLKVSEKIYKSVDHITVTSRSFQKYLEEKFGLDSSTIGYMPQYAETLYLSGNVEETEAEKDTINLLFAGNIGEMQSVETIIRSAAELKEIINLKWHIVGEGSARKKCADLSHSLGLSNQVIFHGHRPLSEMPSFFSKASALLVTLKNNQFISYTLPGKVQSYMAAGKPIIGAINGEARTVIEESGCGLCCGAEDYLGLALIVKRFITDLHRHQEFAKNSRNFYDAHFCKEKFITRLLQELNELRKVDEFVQG